MPICSESMLASDAACHLGVSVKALRLYEEKGLLRPMRTDAGYRRYSVDDLRAGQEIVALRSLGLSLTQIAGVLNSNPAVTDQALAVRETELGVQFAALQKASERIRHLRHGLAQEPGHRPRYLADTRCPKSVTVAFKLPWPWDGEQFILAALAPLTYLVGPLGSGKTRLALQLSKTLPNALWLGLQRFDDLHSFERKLNLTPDEILRVESHLECLRKQGAVDIEPLRLLMVALEASGGHQPLVIEMIEEGLSRPSQEALVPLLRHLLRTRAGPVIAMTRSSSVLALASVGPDEAILYCPPNHSVPFVVLPFAGSAGYEAVSLALATPEARKRIARHPAQAGK